jgi:hypothetical protein
MDKNKYQLPEEERERTQSILKRALDVEKGVSENPPVTEEHPDGCKSYYEDMHMLYLVANLMSEVIILSKLNMFYTYIGQKRLFSDIVCSSSSIICIKSNLALSN